MRLGGEPVGRWGIALLAGAGNGGPPLGWAGWARRAAGVAPSLAGKAASNGSARGTQGTASSPSPAQSSSAQPSSAPASPAASPGPTAPAKAGPLLSSEPYASVTYRIWPGPLSATARQALTRLKGAVHQHAPGLPGTAGGVR